MVPLTEWITDGIRDLTREEVDSVCLTLYTEPQYTMQADGQYVARRNEIRQQYYDYFNSLSLDALLCPVGPAPAQPVGTTKYWPYTSMWNLLDWPAAVFPTGLRVEETDDDMREEEARNEDEAHLYRTCE
jgi:Asp-tRNA(Asn)/Glu-tRNA(Gln) amidotransferase A subunit family amidase